MPNATSVFYSGFLHGYDLFVDVGPWQGLVINGDDGDVVMVEVLVLQRVRVIILLSGC